MGGHGDPAVMVMFYRHPPSRIHCPVPRRQFLKPGFRLQPAWPGSSAGSQKYLLAGNYSQSSGFFSITVLQVHRSTAPSYRPKHDFHGAGYHPRARG